MRVLAQGPGPALPLGGKSSGAQGRTGRARRLARARWAAGRAGRWAPPPSRPTLPPSVGRLGAGHARSEATSISDRRPRSQGQLRGPREALVLASAREFALGAPLPRNSADRRSQWIMN